MMNKIVLFLSALCLIGFTAQYKAQRKLNDPSIVAQGKRQVFESWGDWRPYPKYFLGVQTNFAYSTVWGMLSPARNRHYKNGEDIRPLKAGGVEMQRLAMVDEQKRDAEKISVEVDSIYKRTLQDFAHWTPITASADPLWLLYYKRMLRPLNDFPDNPKNYKEWGIKDDKTYQMMKSYGEIEDLQRRLDLLKDKFHQSRTVGMPRGKRFLMYHECLLEWRNFQNYLKDRKQKSTLILDWKKLIDKAKGIKFKDRQQTDTEIVQEAMNKFNKKLQE